MFEHEDGDFDFAKDSRVFTLMQAYQLRILQPGQDFCLDIELSLLGVGLGHAYSGLLVADGQGKAEFFGAGLPPQGRPSLALMRFDRDTYLATTNKIPLNGVNSVTVRLRRTGGGNVEFLAAPNPGALEWLKVCSSPMNWLEPKYVWACTYRVPDDEAQAVAEAA